MSSNADLYYVKLADGDVHRVSLDQLDDAFQAGHIDGGTMVLAAGAEKWTTLGELAGIDDDVAPVQVIPQNEPRMPAPVPAVYTQLQYPKAVPPRQESAPPPLQQPWQPPRAQPAATYATRSATRSPYGHTSAMPAPRAQLPQSIMPQSVRPVSVDLGQFDPDLNRARRGSGKRWVVALAGLSLLGAAGGIAFVRPPWVQPYLARVGLRAPSVAVAAAAPRPAAVEALPLPPPAAAPPAPPQAAPPAAKAPSAGDSPLSPHFTDRFTPEQKEKLAQADKAKAKGRVKVSSPSRNMSKAKSTTFTTGGNKFDPLNSSI